MRWRCRPALPRDGEVAFDAAEVVVLVERGDEVEPPTVGGRHLVDGPGDGPLRLRVDFTARITGEDGVRKGITLLRDEVSRNMAMLGVNDLRELDASYLLPAAA